MVDLGVWVCIAVLSYEESMNLEVDHTVITEPRLRTRHVVTRTRRLVPKGTLNREGFASVHFGTLNHVGFASGLGPG